MRFNTLTLSTKIIWKSIQEVGLNKEASSSARDKYKKKENNFFPHLLPKVHLNCLQYKPKVTL